MRKKAKNNQGFTLIEMLVAISIFTVIAVSSTQIFQMVLKSQRQTIYAQDIQENTRFSVEAMSKEIRNAIIDRTGDCVGQTGLIYNTSDTFQKGSDLYFINQYGECVNYFYDDKRLKISRTPLNEDLGLIKGEKREAFITPSSIDFLEPVFLINNGADPDVQSRVTMVLRFVVDREAGYKEVVNAQTTVSSRYYPVRVAEPTEPEPEEPPVYNFCGNLASATWLTNCSGGPVDAGEHDTVRNISNTASGYSGSADFKCNDGDWEFQSGTCSLVPAYCDLPWGGTIFNEQTIAACLSSSVGCGQSCQCINRKCEDGKLSGSDSYQYKTCTKDCWCDLPDWDDVYKRMQDGSSRWYYKSNLVYCSDTSESQCKWFDKCCADPYNLLIITCNDGTLYPQPDSDYQYTYCNCHN